MCRGAFFTPTVKANVAAVAVTAAVAATAAVATVVVAAFVSN